MMIGSALAAFGHFIVFFSLTAALVLQLGLLQPSPDIDTAKRIQRADRAYGLMALLILIFGLLRVFYFGHGADFYFSNLFFWMKMVLFVGVGLMSIRPTVTYLRWRSEIEQGIAPTFSEASAQKLRKLLHYQLIAIGGVIFCASMMAKGIGFIG